MRGAGALDLGGVLDGFQQRHRIVAAHHLAAAPVISRLSASAAVALSSAIDAPLLRELGESRRQRVRLRDVGILLQMVARAVGEFSMIDEHGRAAVLRHQRVGQRQRRMRDVGAADVEGPGHRMRIRQHQRIGAELCDLAADAPELVGLRFAGELRAVNRDRAERRGGALGPHRIERIAVDRDQFGAGLGAGRRQPLGCRRSVQPWIKSEAVAGHEVLCQPGFRRRLDQRLDAPGLAVDLFGRLQGVAAVDENRGLLGQHDRQSGRSGKAGQPRQPLFGSGTYSFCC